METGMEEWEMVAAKHYREIIDEAVVKYSTQDQTPREVFSKAITKLCDSDSKFLIRPVPSKLLLITSQLLRRLIVSYHRRSVHQVEVDETEREDEGSRNVEREFESKRTIPGGPDSQHQAVHSSVEAASAAGGNAQKSSDVHCNKNVPTCPTTPETKK
jgi:hypothetical protein